MSVPAEFADLLVRLLTDRDVYVDERRGGVLIDGSLTLSPEERALMNCRSCGHPMWNHRTLDKGTVEIPCDAPVWPDGEAREDCGCIYPRFGYLDAKCHVCHVELNQASPSTVGWLRNDDGGLKKSVPIHVKCHPFLNGPTRFFDLRPNREAS